MPHGRCTDAHSRLYTTVNTSPPGAPYDDDGWTNDDVAHIKCGGLISDAGPAVCGVWPPDDDPTWYGTGTQDELDTAKVLPLCRECIAVLS